MNRVREDQAHAQNCACWAGEIRGKQVAELHTYLYIKGTVAQQIHNEFASDLIIKLVPGNQARAGLKNPRATPSIADVKVSSKVSIKEVYGVNRQTGKPGKMVAVAVEATITSRSRRLYIPSPNPTIFCKMWKSSSVLPSKSNRSLSKRSVRTFPPINPLSLPSTGRRFAWS